ncbi:MAG: efflux transporter outer membrane subunit [Azonexus sp.]|jgi:NodT family efflux transporter outer membrane factor (OMF) lipoprotein|uniref:efflux transporter outer membrane subunit n=1 Tax=Azonexus sp. TaxID=1872668 RepID=UPI00281BA151|nr:efflux transporter outer membrane subunit [Azonexus sp.]MDR0776410.1 efflux transporter outer membrane subunit [Azonexus sp.]
MSETYSSIRSRLWIGSVLAALLTACTTVGPNFKPPETPAPDDWSSWNSAGSELARSVGKPGSPQSRWWEAFNDPVLNELEQKALSQNPDLRTAALHYAQFRALRDVAGSQQGPDVRLQAGMNRQRQSEYAAGDRVLDIIAPDNRDALAGALSAPFTQYQAGIDLSWEIDLWGRVRRAVEGADADAAASAALLDQTRVSIASELAGAYVSLRTTQRLAKLTHDDIAAMRERIRLMASRRKHGLVGDVDLERQRLELANLEAQLPTLLEQEAQTKNRIGLLLGLHPGELSQMLATTEGANAAPVLPEYTLGLPSELAARRPDIRASLARLHQSTAAIGEAQAQLYPSIRLGVRAGLDSYEAGKFGDWGSRLWSIGPSIDLPIFDGGRRRTTVKLRELKQQEAAIDFQRTVLRAWQEIDDALTAYAAEQQRQQRLALRAQSSAEVYQLVQARERAGLTDFLNVIDAQRSDIQARRDMVSSQGRAQAQFIAVYRALGVLPSLTEDLSGNEERRSQ